MAEMNKIDHILPGQIKPQGQEQKPGKPTQGPSFQDLLDKATNISDSKSQAVQAAQPFDPLNLVNGVKPPVTAEPLTREQTEGLMRAERTLEILDDYQSALSDGGKTLKDAGKLVESLEEEVRQLTGVLDRMDKDDELYGLLEEVAVTAMVESVKFNRGDYLPV